MKQKIFLTICLMLLVGFVVFVSAVDVPSLPGETSVDTTGTSVNIQLQKGWNLVASGSFAHGPGITSDSQIQNSNIKAIFYYSPSQKKYLQIVPYPNTEKEKEEYNYIFEKEDAIEENYQIESRATWVFSDKEGTLKFETDYVLPSSQRQLRIGWNFVGMTSDVIAGYYDSNYDGSYKGKWFSWDSIKGDCQYEKIFGWFPTDQDWFEMRLDEKLQESDIKPFLGLGFVIKVSDDCKLGTSESTTGPPQIPNNSINININCSDTEEGIDYNIKGTVTDYSGSIADVCIESGSMLREYSCSTRNYQWEDYECPNGCLDGACIK